MLNSLMLKRPRSWTGVLALVVAVGALGVSTSGQQGQAGGGGRGGGQGRGGAPQPSSTLPTMFVQGFNNTKVYLIAGAGGNIVAQVGDDGVLLVDTGNAESGEKVVATVRQLSPRPIR